MSLHLEVLQNSTLPYMKKHCAYITGSGATHDGWKPVLRALEKIAPFKFDSDTANAFLARSVYLLRWYSQSNVSKSNGLYKDNVSFLNTIKNEISKELKKAEYKKEIFARNELTEIFDRYVFPYSNSFMLYTTNWEKTTEICLKNHITKWADIVMKTIYVHGNYDDPKTLYLPSEMIGEPYRSESEIWTLGKSHGSMRKSLEKATRIILYGISISPLDAELSQFLATGMNNGILSEILIIDPDFDIVAKRVRLLIDPKKDIEILGINPKQIDQYKNIENG